jgi:uncharacterized protein YbjT (DUF2867 family)
MPPPVHGNAERLTVTADSRSESRIGVVTPFKRETVAPTGAIAITGASGQVGTPLQRRLRELRHEVRPLGRDDNLRRAFAGADAVVHLAGALRPGRGNSYREANVDTLRRTLAALEDSTVRRVVFVSYIGADPGAKNEYLRMKGEAEELLLASGHDVVIFRCTHIFGPPEEPGPTVEAFLTRKGKPVSVLGSGQQRWAPVYREDVVEAIVRALRPEMPSGRADLTGPEVITVDEFVRAVNGADLRLRHIPVRVARVLGHVVPTLTPALVDILLSDSVGDLEAAARVFGLERRRVAEIYRDTE